MEVDVAVLGAGPAGAFAGALLARQGLTTVLVDPGRPQRKRSEWLSARGAAELQVAGFGQVLARAAAVAAARVVVHRDDGGDAVVQPSVHWLGSATLGHAWLVDRRALDQALRDNALRQGCRLWAPWVAADVVRFGARWRIEARSRVGQRTIVATHVIDATGAGRRPWRSWSPGGPSDATLRYHLWTTRGCVDVQPELHVIVADETMRAYCMTGGGHPDLWAVVAERPISSTEAASELRLLKRRLAPHLPSRRSDPDLARLGSWSLPLARMSVSQSDVVAVGDAERLHDVATGRGLERALTTAAAAAYAIHCRPSPHSTAVDAIASSNP